MKIISLLNELESLVQEGMHIPLSTKVVVNSEEALEIIHEIINSLPEEIKQAQWIKEERKKILIEAQKDSEKILGDAESKIRQMVDENQITQSAYQEAEEIRKKAEEISKEIRKSTNEYADNVLKKMYLQLKSLMEQIEEDRNELRGK
ncbi:MAG: ATPase [Eubacteriales bacterium]